MESSSVTRILLPLYIYPHPGAWDPLHAAYDAGPDFESSYLTSYSFAKYPEFHFVIIVNPNNGPGEAPWWPNGDYVREIDRLNDYHNVTLVGYLMANYCKRPLDDVIDDIETYASRSRRNEGLELGMHGIFVDETVNLYTKAAKRYLDEIDRKVRVTDGFGEGRLVIHNPGTAVNVEFASPGPDVTVVVETSYAQFVTEEYQEWLQTSPYGRSRSCYMLHSVPVEKVKSLTKTLREKAGYLFLTSATVNFYNQWAASWKPFLAALADT